MFKSIIVLDLALIFKINFPEISVTLMAFLMLSLKKTLTIPLDGLGKIEISSFSSEIPLVLITFPKFNLIANI